MNEFNVFIDSVQSVKKCLQDTMEVNAPEHEIRHVMRHDLNMKYRKVLPVSIHGNSEKNLVLRQQFARNMINLLKAGKTLLNVDETWLGMTDFRRMKW